MAELIWNDPENYMRRLEQVLPESVGCRSLFIFLLFRLLEKTGTDPTRIGRLEVGTETIIDKSKSVKSVLMQVRKFQTQIIKIFYNIIIRLWIRSVSARVRFISADPDPDPNQKTWREISNHNV